MRRPASALEWNVFAFFLSMAAGLFLLTTGWLLWATRMEAIETDANGYLCQKCNAKIYTDSRVFPKNVRNVIKTPWWKPWVFVCERSSPDSPPQSFRPGRSGLSASSAARS